MINLVMPMGGRGERFKGSNIELPKPLIPIQSKPFFYWATQSIYKFYSVKNLIFIILKEHNDRYNLGERIKHFYSNAKVILLNEVLKGPLLTCKEGLNEIDNDYPIVFNDCDHIFYSHALYRFLSCTDPFGKHNMDGLILTFFSDNPAYSYCRTNNSGYVIETVEKKVVSKNAISGAYFFRNKHTFLEEIKAYIDDCPYDEYFISGLYNKMISNNKKVINLNVDFNISFGVVDEYDYVKDHRIFEFFL